MRVMPHEVPKSRPSKTTQPMSVVPWQSEGEGPMAGHSNGLQKVSHQSARLAL